MKKSILFITFIMIFTINACNNEKLPPEWLIYNNDGKEIITIEELYVLAAKGEALTFEDLNAYQWFNFSSTEYYYILGFGVEGGYRMPVNADAFRKIISADLERIWDERGTGIDIRFNDLELFLRENPSQPGIPEQDAFKSAIELTSLPLEPVSYDILAYMDIPVTQEEFYFINLIDSHDILPEPIYLYRDISTNHSYYAVGKKTGTIYFGISDENGNIENWNELS